MSRERKACPLPSGTRNQAGWTSSVWCEVTRKKCLSSSIWYRDSSRWHFVHPVRSRAKGELILVRPKRGVKQARIRPSDMKSHERRACPPPSSKRNHVGGTSSIRYEVARMKGLPSSIQHEESSTRGIVCLVRCRVKGELVLVRLVLGML